MSRRVDFSEVESKPAPFFKTKKGAAPNCRFDFAQAVVNTNCRRYFTQSNAASFQDGEDDGGGVLFGVVDALGGFLEVGGGGFHDVDEFLGVAVG